LGLVELEIKGVVCHGDSSEKVNSGQ
jgi:hypothetical protein